MHDLHFYTQLKCVSSFWYSAVGDPALCEYMVSTEKDMLNYRGCCIQITKKSITNTNTDALTTLDPVQMFYHSIAQLEIEVFSSPTHSQIHTYDCASDPFLHMQTQLYLLTQLCSTTNMNMLVREILDR